MGKKRGKCIVRADSVAQSNDEVSMAFSARLTPKGGLCCGSDSPFVIMSRARSTEAAGSDSDFIRIF